MKEYVRIRTNERAARPENAHYLLLTTECNECIYNNFKIDMIDGIQAGRQYLTRSVFNALSIGSGLVASVVLCMKRGDI